MLLENGADKLALRRAAADLQCLRNAASTKRSKAKGNKMKHACNENAVIPKWLVYKLLPNTTSTGADKSLPFSDLDSDIS